MFKSIKSKSFVVVFLLLLFIVMVSFTRIFFDLIRGEPKKWLDQNFGGVIVERDWNIVKVQNRKGVAKDFEISSSTRIFSGGDELYVDNLVVGDLVLIEMQTKTYNSNGSYPAKSIRLLEDQKLIYDTN